MVLRYVLAQLQGGPLDGQTVQVPVRPDTASLPERVIGLPVIVLDEDSERFSWDTANYFALSLPVRVGAEQRPVLAYARTLPGFPTFTTSAAVR